MKDPSLGRERVLTWMFGIGLVATSATSFRVPSLGIGPGEALLALWFVLSLPELLRVRRPEGVGKALLVFWCGAAILLALGFVVGLITGHSTFRVYHNVIAYLFDAGTTVAFAVLPRLRPRVRTLLPILLTGVALPLILLVGYQQFVSDTLAPLTLGRVFEGTARFYGWASNPNGLAIIIVPLPFFAAWLVRETRGPGRWWHAGTGVASVIVGVATRSDALAVAWLGSGVLLAILLWGRAYAERKGSRARRRRFVGATAIVLVCLSLAAVLAAPTVASYATNRYNSGGGEGHSRLPLWRHGIEALAASPLVGLGPGSFSGLDGPFLDFEAHNTLIDWADQAGVAGVVLLIWFVLLVTRAAWQLREPYGLAVVTGLVLLSMFHYVLRHPEVWISLVSVVALCHPQPDDPTPRVHGSEVADSVRD